MKISNKKQQKKKMERTTILERAKDYQGSIQRIGNTFHANLNTATFRFFDKWWHLSNVVELDYNDQSSWRI